MNTVLEYINLSEYPENHVKDYTKNNYHSRIPCALIEDIINEDKSMGLKFIILACKRNTLISDTELWTVERAFKSTRYSYPNDLRILCSKINQLESIKRTSNDNFEYFVIKPKYGHIISLNDIYIDVTHQMKKVAEEIDRLETLY